MAGGQQINAGQGTILGGQAVSGSEAASAAGTAPVAALVKLASRKVGGGTATFPLSGQASSAVAGTLLGGPGQVLTGSGATAGLGTVTKTRQIQAVGMSASGIAGNVGVSSGAVSGVVTYTLLSSAGGTNLPFVIGHNFVQGDVPAGSISGLGGNTALQINVRNAWPDGSAKFALVSGRKTLAASSAGTVAIQLNGSVASGTTLTTANLSALTVTIDAGSFGSVTWNSADWPTPFYTDAQGPELLYVTYRKQVGSDPTLSMWIEVQLFADGRGNVLPYVENGKLKTTTTNKVATYVVTINGTQVYSALLDLKEHTRTVLMSGTATEYWFGGVNPAITPTHDKAYLQATKVIPTYRGVVPSSADPFSTLVSSFTPFMLGNYHTPMGDTGFSPHIGLLPEWEVLHLTANDSRTYKAVLYNAFGAGRYGIHYRDETTNRPLRFSDHPNLVLDNSASIADKGGSDLGDVTSPVSGGNNDVWDTPHCPNIGYLAYLLTGRRYFMEEVQFAATINYLKESDLVVRRNRGLGYIKTESGAYSPRGAAWTLRTLACATSVTPDADVLQAQFTTIFANNIDLYYNKYIAQTHNPQGFIHPYGADIAIYAGNTASPSACAYAAWQDNFFTGVCGFAKDIVPGLNATSVTRFNAFFQWKGRTIVGLLGGPSSTEYNYRDAAPYAFAVAPSASANFDTGAGPWFSDFGAIYQATRGSPNDGTTGDLRGGSAGDPNVSPFTDGGQGGGNAYWGQIQPAISYAVDNAVPGAWAAYNRMTAASNFTGALTTYWNDRPIWGIKPRSTFPTWLQGRALNDGMQIPNSRWDSIQLAGRGQPFNYSGGGSDGQRMFVFGGGRSDSNDNSMSAIDLSANAPSWSRLWGPSPTSAIINAATTWSDGAPASHHTYGLGVYNPVTGKFHQCGGAGPVDQSLTYGQHDVFDVATAAAGGFPWTTLANWGAGYVDGSSCCDSSGNIYLFTGHGPGILKWTRTTNAISTFIPISGYDGYASIASDVANSRALTMPTPPYPGGGGVLTAKEIDLSAATQTNVTFSGATIGNVSWSHCYDTVNRCYWAYRWGDGAIFKLVRFSSSSYTATQVTPTGVGPGAQSGLTAQYPHNRFCFINSGPVIGIAFVRDAQTNLWFMRTA